MTENKTHPKKLDRLTAVAAIFLLALALGGLLGVTLTGCGEQQVDAVEAMPETAPVISELPATITVPTAAPALASAAEAPDPAIPTTIPTFTPIPTATATDSPTAIPPTAVPTLTTIPPTATALPPLPTPVGVYSWTLKVPILMYHYISTPPEGADKYRLDLSVTPEEFERQMAYLAENGFETVSLYDLSLAITAKSELPSRPVIITMDDGYVDNYENALPILQKYGMEATFFIVTQFIDEGRAGYLTWDMVEEMAAAGMRIEPHSKTHPDLSGAERDFVIYEMLGAQETIAAHTGITPRYFCYPGGRYDQQTMDIAAELDFWGAVTTADGQWHGFDDRFEWSRVRMRNSTTLPEFAALIAPGDTVAGKSPQS
jgi:peptidoglycan/xylan/chitin deacetylase (PgdA/CDA1 family)